VTARGAGYAEDRNNGTVVQVNTTDWQQFSVEAAAISAAASCESTASAARRIITRRFSAVWPPRAGRATER
jgi:hypothetical protein